MKLADWHADPMSIQEAEQRLLQTREVTRNSTKPDYFELQLREMIARFWLGRDIQSDMQHLLSQCKGDEQEAWVYTVCGQLYMSCKRNGASQMLQTGLGKASRVYSAREYLKVMKQTELLANIIETQAGSPAVNLETLLTEASVIKKLSEKNVYNHQSDTGKDDISG